MNAPIISSPSLCPAAGAFRCAQIVVDSDGGFQWSDVLTGATSAFLGAMFAFGFAIWLARRDRVAQWTSALITEFSSRGMLESRFVTADISTKVREGTLSLRHVALTTVQDCPVGFIGRTINGLTEHQHMSQLIGWIRILAVHLRHRWVDRRIMAATIGGSLQWTLPFLLELADEADRVMEDYPSPKPPQLRASWVYAVRNVDAQLRRARPHERTPGGRSPILRRRRP